MRTVCSCSPRAATVIVAAALGGGAGLALAPSAAFAASYAFNNIADSTGAFSTFSVGRSVALNDSGQVAFYATLDAGGQGIFKGNGAVPNSVLTVADHGAFSSFGSPDLNNNNFVYFQATRTSGTSGVFGGLGINANAGILTYADTTGPFGGFVGPVETKGGNSSKPAFTAVLSSGGNAILRGSDTTNSVTTIADESGAPFNAVGAHSSINAGGTVAFRATKTTGVTGIYSGTGATPNVVTTIADTTGPFFAGFADSAAINDSGVVAFTANLNAGGQGIFTGNGAVPNAVTAIAVTSGPFSGFASATVNNDGTVAFQAGLDDGGNGIFTGPDVANDKVIAVGDPLFGSTVFSLNFFPAGLNDQGQVAFEYQLANGVSGVARATVTATPEPGSLAVLALAGVAMLRRRRTSDL